THPPARRAVQVRSQQMSRARTGGLRQPLESGSLMFLPALLATSRAVAESSLTLEPGFVQLSSSGRYANPPDFLSYQLPWAKSIVPKNEVGPRLRSLTHATGHEFEVRRASRAPGMHPDRPGVRELA